MTFEDDRWFLVTGHTLSGSPRSGVSSCYQRAVRLADHEAAMTRGTFRVEGPYTENECFGPPDTKVLYTTGKEIK